MTFTAEFAHLRIAYDQRILEPRSWTAIQSRWAAELLEDAPPGPLLEVCSGAGHIGLLAADLSGRPLVAVDIDPVACDFMRRNAEGAGLGQRVEVREGTLASALRHGEQFALVLADPPWVITRDVTSFPDDPVLAIDGGEDGMTVTRTLLRDAAGRLPPGASMLVQLKDVEQADDVAHDGQRLGWSAGECRIGARGVVLQLVWKP